MMPFSTISTECFQAAVLIQAVLLVGCAAYIVHLSRIIRDLRSKEDWANVGTPAAIVGVSAGSKPSAEPTEAVGERPDAEAPKEETPKEEAPVAAACICNLISSIGEENLRDLLKSRIDDLDDEEGDVAKALAIVGILDEIRILNAGANESDARAMQTLDAALRRMLAELGAEMIDDDVWHPARQRATEVQHDLPVGSEPLLGEKVASGLIYQGRIYRKQTVTLHMQVL